MQLEPMLNSKCLLIDGNTFSLPHLWKYWRCGYGSPLETGERNWWCCPCSLRFVSVCCSWSVWSCFHLQPQTAWKCSCLWSLFKFLSPPPLSTVWHLEWCESRPAQVAFQLSGAVWVWVQECFYCNNEVCTVVLSCSMFHNPGEHTLPYRRGDRCHLGGNCKGTHLFTAWKLAFQPVLKQLLHLGSAGICISRESRDWGWCCVGWDSGLGTLKCFEAKPQNNTNIGLDCVGTELWESLSAVPGAGGWLDLDFYFIPFLALRNMLV